MPAERSSAWAASVARCAEARPWRFLTWIAVVTVVLGTGVLRLELRTDGAAIYPTGDPTVERTRQDRRDFRELEQVVALVTATSAEGTVVDHTGLAYVKRLHESLAGVPGVDAGRSFSLATIPDPTPGGSQVFIPSLLDELPSEEGGLVRLRERIRASPMARGLFVSDDGRAAAIVVSLDRRHPREEVFSDLEAWVEHQRIAGFELGLTGPVAAEVSLGRAVLVDLLRLVPAMMAVVALLLFVSLRCVGGVLVALAEVGLVLVWTLGLMGHLGMPVTIVTTVLPVVVLAMAVIDEIHLLQRFAVHRRHDREVQGSPMLAAVRDVASPIILTSLTTAAGLLSFLAASIAPIRQFGLFAAIGILFAMGLSFSFVPAAVAALPDRWFRVPAHRAGIFRVRRTGKLGALLVGGAVVLVVAPGVGRLAVQDSWIDNLDPESRLVRTEHAFNEHLWGTYRYDVVLHGPDTYFQRAEGLQLLADVERAARSGPFVGGVLSQLSAYETAAVLEGEPGSILEATPETVWRISGLLHLFQRRIGLRQLLRGDGAAARVRIFVNSADFERVRRLETHLARAIPRAIGARAVGYHFSGDLPASQAAVRSVVSNMTRSITWALPAVALILSVAYRSVPLGLVALAPLGFSLTVLLGTMGYGGVPLGIATSMFCAVAIGVGVDFAVHYLHACEQLREDGVEPTLVASSAWHRVGPSIQWSALVLTLGPLVLALSGMLPVRSLGLLLSAAIALCYVATRMLLPPIVTRWFGSREVGRRASHDRVVVPVHQGAPGGK
ncbi:MAG: MMPL family transporter [bacterium]|nr:MMPL family transporter [bacterium]